MRLLLLYFFCFPTIQLFSQKVELGIPVGHEFRVTGLASSPDRSAFVTWSQYEKEPIIWDASSGKLLRRLSGHTSDIKMCFFLSDTFLVSFSHDSTVRLWNITNGTDYMVQQKLTGTNIYHLGGLRCAIVDGKELLHLEFALPQDKGMDSAKTTGGGQPLSPAMKIKKVRLKLPEYYSQQRPQHGKFVLCTTTDSRRKYKKTTTYVLNIETGFVLGRRNENIPDDIHRWDSKPEYVLDTTGNIVYFVGRNYLAKYTGENETGRIDTDTGYALDLEVSPDRKWLALLTYKRLILIRLSDFSVHRSLVLNKTNGRYHDYRNIGWNAQSTIVLAYPFYSYQKEYIAYYPESDKVVNRAGKLSSVQLVNGRTFLIGELGRMSEVSSIGEIGNFFEQVEMEDISEAWISQKFNRRIEMDDTTFRVYNFFQGQKIATIEFPKYNTIRFDSVHGYVYYLNNYLQLGVYSLKNDSHYVVDLYSGENVDDFVLTPDGKYMFCDFSGNYVECEEGSPESESEWGCGRPPAIDVFSLPDFKKVQTFSDTARTYINFNQITFVDTPYRGMATLSQVEQGVEVRVFSYLYNPEPVYKFTVGHYSGQEFFKFADNGHKLQFDVGGYGIEIYSISGEKYGSFSGMATSIISSPDNKYYLLNDENSGFYVFDETSRRPVFSVPGYWTDIRFINGAKRVIAREYSSVFIYDIPTRSIVGKVNKLNSSILWASLRDSNTLELLTSDMVHSFWDLRTGDWILKRYRFNDRMLTVLNNGLFDADARDFNMLYWVQGMETIEFAQLKERYWEPGLWEKWVKGEKIRDVGNMSGIKLQPEIHVGELTGLRVPLTITKRSGGYGRIAVFVNGKEAFHDLRNENFDTSKHTQVLWLDITDSPYLIDSGINTVTVKTWSADGFVSSRGENISIKTSAKKHTQPAFYAVICGVSDYANKGINLRYPVADAISMRSSLGIGATNLFHNDSIHFFMLTSDTGTNPEKEQVRKAFHTIAGKAKAEDVIIVYLSGHGLTLGGDNSDFYYLTSEAFTLSAESYLDPAIRQSTTISSSEIINWMNEIHANKQLMIMDACGSGKAVENLVAKRSVDASQIKAIDRMRDRTGMHIISGCAADAVSYEASVFGQGLLTYSLLEGMKGGALRENKYLDVNKLMQYAVERVPVLASDVGGIQKPQILSPQGSQSFDIGILNEPDRIKIPLAQPKPVFVRSRIFTPDLDDPKGLSAAVDGLLSNMSSGNDLVFFDAFSYPEAWQVKGFYKVENGKITLNLVLKKNAVALNREVVAISVSELLSKLEDEIHLVLRQNPAY